MVYVDSKEEYLYNFKKDSGLLKDKSKSNYITKNKLLLQLGENIRVLNLTYKDKGYKPEIQEKINKELQEIGIIYKDIVRKHLNRQFKSKKLSGNIEIRNGMVFKDR